MWILIKMWYNLSIQERKKKRNIFSIFPDEKTFKVQDLSSYMMEKKPEKGKKYQKTDYGSVKQTKTFITI